MARHILTVNSGSSSLKFALFRAGGDLVRIVTGTFARIGGDYAELSATELASGVAHQRRLALPDHAACEPPLVTGDVLAELRRLIPFAPVHEPAAVALLEAFGRHYPGVPQVACFDT